MSKIFVEVIVPLALPATFTYEVSPENVDKVMPGVRVVVPFGHTSNKLYAAIVIALHRTNPSSRSPKSILGVLDESPIVNETQIKLWKWMAEYYMCTLGEMMVAALPSGLKLQSETKIVVHPDFDGDISSLTDREQMVIAALQSQKSLSIAQVQDLVELKTVLPIIKSLIDQKVVLAVEHLNQKYKPKVVQYVRLTAAAATEENLKEYLNSLESKAPLQLKLLLNFLKISRFFSTEKVEVKKTYLQTVSGVSSAVVQAMVAKGIFELYSEEESRLDKHDENGRLFKLNDAQQKSILEIKESWQQHPTTVLHGITGSGKTEIYIQLIQEVITEGKQALFLVPEIALTTQLISRLRRAFGDAVGIYHSKFNENERVEIWNEVLNFPVARFKVVIGARSALFLPYKALGLVIVDEEHETSYKQTDPAPRYHARDTALLLAKMHNCKALLGSATPSLESIYNVKLKKYGYVSLTERHGSGKLPEIIVADMKKEKKEKTMKAMFSNLLIEKMTEVLNKKKQVILFQNRRGFSPFLQCQACGHSISCINCDITLTYHKYLERLICHYCGHGQKVPLKCPECNSSHQELVGFGTEKVEEDLQIIFPNAKIKRLDLDSARAKNAYHEIITDFENQTIDILVGTQMISKGLDFDHVGLVGILDADSLIRFPEFRAQERAYQLMSQVAGRAGRKDGEGLVVIQTAEPYNNIVQQVMYTKYEDMVKEQLRERQHFAYPPHFKLIKILLKGKDVEEVKVASKELAQHLGSIFGKRVIGPQTPLVGKINKLYIKSILVKIEPKVSYAVVKQKIRGVLDVFEAKYSIHKVRVILNIDA